MHNFRDLPVFHFNNSALDNMGVYDNARVQKFQNKGWQYHETDQHPKGGFLFKYLSDGREVRIYDRRTFLKTRTWFVVTVFDKYGRECGEWFYDFK